MSQPAPEMLARLLIRPFHKPVCQDHLSCLQTVRSVLVACPENLTQQSARELIQFFRKQNLLEKISYVNFNASQKHLASDIMNAEFITMPCESSIQVIASRPFRTLIRKKFDLFLDLNTTRNMLGPTLALFINAGIRLRFAQKSHSVFYNMEYMPQNRASFDLQLRSMIHFLKRALTSES